MSADSFSALPQYLQRRIDNAFNALEGVFSRKTGCGSLAEKGSVLVDNATQISLSSIPKLLQRLDLPPDDAQIGDTDTEEAYVSRDNWRAICAVLLDDYDENDGVGVVEEPSIRRRTRTTAKWLTVRQTEACLATYTLFPSASEEELSNQRAAA
ncbi:hypothetical protein B0H13DRAFT_2649264 [Mycena leptocephala]|nr:hypothetical protein B0H13DRAFT_2649264 [Mycena leptocephala]